MFYSRSSPIRSIVACHCHNGIVPTAYRLAHRSRSFLVFFGAITMAKVCGEAVVRVSPHAIVVTPSDDAALQCLVADRSNGAVRPVQRSKAHARRVNEQMQHQR